METKKHPLTASLIQVGSTLRRPVYGPTNNKALHFALAELASE